jgi:small conductance mechanosensitive channel
MILVLKPFKVGDDIKALGEHGVVSEIQIFNTYLKTADNKVLVFPNGPLANGTIVNHTRETTRRIEWTFVFDHSAQITDIQQVIGVTLKADKRVLLKPEPIVGVQQLTEAGLEIKVKCWVKNTDYGMVFHQTQQALIEAAHVAALPFAKS